MARERVLLLGDAVRVAYHGRLTGLLAAEGFTVVGPLESTGDCLALADGIEWRLREFGPDVACFACGAIAAEAIAAWSTGREAQGPEFVPMAMHERSLLRIAELLRGSCGQQVVYVTSPPVDVGRCGASMGPLGRDAAEVIDRSIKQYNEQAMTLMGALNVSVADLHREIARAGSECFGEGGVGLSERGIEVGAQAVAKGIFGVIHA